MPVLVSPVGDFNNNTVLADTAEQGSNLTPDCEADINVKKTVYKPLGFLFLGLAGLGIVLPILPATPFLLLSAWFFARSSGRWHQRLLNSELFGPMIRNWEQNRCITRRTKIVALTSMTLVGGASLIFAVEGWQLRLAGLVLMSVGCITVLSIKTCNCSNK